MKESQQKNQQRNKNQGGFTLIEMLVAVFLFTIVMLVSMTSVLALIDANKKNQSTLSIVNNLTLVVNSIVKSIAVSKGYYCGNAAAAYNGTAGSDCLTNTPGESITFLTPANSAGGISQIVRYKFVVGANGAPGRIERAINSVTDLIPIDFIPITSPEIDVKSLKFYVYDTAPLVYSCTTACDLKQPRVVMMVQGIAGTKDNTKTQFNIQTTVSQRKLDATF